MKPKAGLTILLLALAGLSSCASPASNDFALYYSYDGDGKGVEVYCWEAGGILVFGPSARD